MQNMQTTVASTSSPRTPGRHGRTDAQNARAENGRNSSSWLDRRTNQPQKRNTKFRVSNVLQSGVDPIIDRGFCQFSEFLVLPHDCQRPYYLMIPLILSTSTQTRWMTLLVQNNSDKQQHAPGQHWTTARECSKICGQRIEHHNPVNTNNWLLSGDKPKIGDGRWHGRWHGPGVIILNTAGGAWVDMRAFVWRVAHEQMRPATQEESQGAELV